MKLLLENWREYLNEDYQETGYQDTKPFKHYGEKGRKPAELEADRDFKREWNKKADHKFFNDDVTKVHWIGGFGGENLNTCKMKPEPCLLNSIKSWVSSQNPKNELSVVGYYKTSPSKNPLSVVGVLIEGYVSYASSEDAATEWSSYADEEAREKHTGSGLPKRAMVKSPMFGPEDFVEPGFKHNELVVDNWRVKGIILETDFSIAFSYWKVLARKPRPRIQPIQQAKKKEFRDIIEFSRANGIKVYDMNLKELQDNETHT